jgi:multiple sugar transport system substrate-binding protein
VINACGGASDDGKKVILNSPETVAAVTFLADIYTNAKCKNMLPPDTSCRC